MKEMNRPKKVPAGSKRENRSNEVQMYFACFSSGLCVQFQAVRRGKLLHTSFLFFAALLLVPSCNALSLSLSLACQSMLVTK